MVEVYYHCLSKYIGVESRDQPSGGKLSIAFSWTKMKQKLHMKEQDGYAIHGSTWLKVSEGPFKENKNTLKIIQVLLYTHFYNISLNVLRPNYVIYLFHTFQISGKLASKLGQKLTTFPTLWAPAPTEL